MLARVVVLAPMSQKRVLELADELSMVRRELKRQRAAAQIAARSWNLTSASRHVVLIIFDLAQADLEPNATYLRALARERHWEDKSDAECRAIVEDVFLEATASAAGLESYAALVDASAPSDADAMRSALRYVEEWRVVVWAREQNLDKD